jgi:nucleolysin TIA-1/TIAR
MGSGDQSGGIMSPGSGGPFARRAAPEPNKRALYVGGLDPRVTEDVLRQIFETTGHVQNVKIIPDKNVGSSVTRSLVLLEDELRGNGGTTC